MQAANAQAAQRGQSSQFFIKYQTNSEGKPVYTPCDLDTEGAEKTQLAELQADQLQPHLVMMVRITSYV